MRGESDLLYLYGETWDGNKAAEFRKRKKKEQKDVIMLNMWRGKRRQWVVMSVWNIFRTSGCTEVQLIYRRQYSVLSWC